MHLGAFFGPLLVQIRVPEPTVFPAEFLMLSTSTPPAVAPESAGAGTGHRRSRAEICFGLHERIPLIDG